jgi:hypothetical protein
MEVAMIIIHWQDFGQQLTSCGNSNNCTQTVTVQDTTRPAITCPINVTINCEASTAPSNTGSATATDNCQDVVTISHLQTQELMEAVMIIIRLLELWTAVDSCGNSNNCTQINSSRYHKTGNHMSSECYH